MVFTLKIDMCLSSSHTGWNVSPVGMIMLPDKSKVPSISMLMEGTLRGTADFCTYKVYFMG